MTWEIRVIPELFSPGGPDMSAVSIPVWLDLTAVVVGSTSGLLVAQERKLDLVGHIVLAMLGGLGGGLIRDIIMQRGSVYMISSELAIPVTVLAGLVGFLFPGLFRKIPNLLEWVDIISVGLFVAAGTDKAVIFSLGPWAAVLMGTVTGVGGGMMRDIFLGDTPRIFRRSNLYAICAVAGAIVYYLAIFRLYINRPWAVALCVLVTVLLRRISLRFNVLSPADMDLTPKVIEGAQQMYNQAIEQGKHESEAIERRRTRKTHDHRMVLVRDDVEKRTADVGDDAGGGEHAEAEKHESD